MTFCGATPGTPSRVPVWELLLKPTVHNRRRAKGTCRGKYQTSPKRYFVTCFLSRIAVLDQHTVGAASDYLLAPREIRVYPVTRGAADLGRIAGIPDGVIPDSKLQFFEFLCGVCSAPGKDVRENKEINDPISKLPALSHTP